MKTMSRGRAGGAAYSIDLALDVTALCASEAGEVLPEGSDCVSVLVKEQAVLGAPRQGLEAERAGAGEQVRHRKPLEAAEAALQHREQALARAVAGRPRRLPSGATSGRPRHSPAMILI
jgi:hypothetical protein